MEVKVVVVQTSVAKVRLPALVIANVIKIKVVQKG